MKRRDFLLRSSLALAALGVGDASLCLCGQRYYRVLAEPTRRKLALLVGINQYPQNPALAGCVTDVELQRELLIHRFGFQPADILTLTDHQATRQNIETAFLSHLREQAKPGDVIVFHFSGYGSLVSGTTPEDAQIGLAAVDSVSASGEDAVHDILEETLLLLLRSLPTNLVTTILDTSYVYSGTALRGNLRIRSRPTPLVSQADKAELRLQAQLLSQINVSKEQISVQRRSGQMPGVVLAAAAPNQLAAEVQWNGFSAGLLTYTLTQQLWRATPATNLRFSLGRVAEITGQVLDPKQQPMLTGQKSREQPLNPFHLVLPESGVDGVVIEAEANGKTGRVWLAGLPASVLEHYGTHSLLTLLPRSDAGSIPAMTASDSLPQLEVLSQDGLTVKVRYIGAGEDREKGTLHLEVGQFVQERLRVLPHNLGLTIALDTSLERIERVDAISAFSAIPRVSSVVAGEQPADYVFGKLTTPTQVAALPSANLPGVLGEPSQLQGSYGLFSPGLEAIADTVGDGGEAVKLAIKRLIPKLQTLLAAKLLTLTDNEASSNIAVRATLEMITPQAQILMQRGAVRSLIAGEALPNPTTGLASVPIGSRIRFRIQNFSDRPLYLILLGRDSNGNLFAVNRPPATMPLANSDTRPIWQQEIAPGELLTIPQTSTALEWVIHGPVGLMETYLICSQAPFQQTLSLLESSIRSIAEVQPLNPLSNPLEVLQTVLQDLHQASHAFSASGSSQSAPSSSPTTFLLDINAWATLKFVYQVV